MGKEKRTDLVLLRNEHGAFVHHKDGKLYYANTYKGAMVLRRNECVDLLKKSGVNGLTILSLDDLNKELAEQ